MKKMIIFLTLLSVLLISACTAVEEPNIDDQGYPSGDDQIFPGEEDQGYPSGDEQVIDNGYTKSSLNRESSPDITPEQIQILAQDNTNFALSFYEKIRPEEGNIIFSPISLSLALSMALAGAETSTEEAMLETLRFSLPEDEIYPTFNALMLAIEGSQEKPMEEAEGDEFQLNIANSIWGQSGYDFEDEFLDILARNYGAGMYLVDYIGNPENARQLINEWVEEETQEKIKDLIPQGAINTLTRMVLANAIYFNASWQYPFNESNTKKAPFTTLDGSQIDVDMMGLSGERLAYTKGDNFQAVNIPYLSSDFSMTIIVPDQGSFQDVEENLSSEQITNILNDLMSQKVTLKMPKFDYESTIGANDPLAALGMSNAFNPELADFSGITEVEKLFISDVLHKATITVDEEGTEAAAATAIVMRATSIDPEEPIELTIDRPFFYFIQHIPTGSILFMGRVVQP
jgi:serpin B